MSLQRSSKSKNPALRSLLGVIQIQRTLGKQNTPKPCAMLTLIWWLETHFPSLQFQHIQTKDETQEIENIVRFVNRGFPVLVAVSHINVEGHIILVAGYE